MRQLRIQGYKCFVDQTISLNQLTVLAGSNSAGKSSVIQALLLMRQAVDRKIFDIGTAEIALNDIYALRLGTYDDIINEASNDIRISLDGNTYTMPFPDERAEQYAAQMLLSDSVNPSPSIIRDKEFRYLNSERLGPRDIAHFRQETFVTCGYQGETTAQAILQTEKRMTDVDTARLCPGSTQTKLRMQIDTWLDYLFPGTVITVEPRGSLHGQIMVKDTMRGVVKSAPNIGFGISYALPIIVEALLATPSTMLIVENPEAHLHPSAQTKMGYFLARMAQAGVVTIIETHSDHLINGIQIAAANRVTDCDIVTINFFRRDDHTPEMMIEQIALNPKGELSKWPRGFFDQAQVDFAELFRARKAYP